ncbi:MAG: DNA polymerase III subunit gamma/tau, partial [Oscillospiraceae bacterium]|nr:DNA polymerase III subunit gamma/tau [Oscillospiraceae bacterium]
EIIDEVSYSPVEGKFKVYIIDEVHMLSIGAFNALLKTLEEPPSYVIFILATTEVHKIPVTILSRCQRYDFKRISIDTIANRLRDLMNQENQLVEEKALRYIAKAADGSMRDALSLLDQCIAFHYGKELTYDNALDVLGAVDTEVFSRLLRAILARSVTDCISLLEEIVMQGRELTQFVSDFTWYLRNLLLVKTSDEGAIEDVIDISSDNLARLKEEADMIQADAIMRYIRELSELSGRIRYAGQKRILIEIALIRLCRPQMEVNTDSLLDRIRAIEQQLESGVFVQQGAAGGQPGGPGAAGLANGAASAQPAKKRELPKAIPEDVSRIVENWPGLVGQTSMPMKLYLKKAKLSLGGDNRLQVVVEDGLASDYFLKQEGNKEELEKLLSEFAQKTIEVNIQVFRGDRDFEENHIDLTQIIHMNIEEE